MRKIQLTKYINSSMVFLKVLDMTFATNICDQERREMNRLSCEQILCNMGMILTKNDLKRIECKQLDGGKMYIDMDLHGLLFRQVEKLLKNVICVNHGEYIINAIHGYNRETALKRMVTEESLSTRITERYSPTWNPGQTYLTIAA